MKGRVKRANLLKNSVEKSTMPKVICILNLHGTQNLFKFGTLKEYGQGSSTRWKQQLAMDNLLYIREKIAITLAGIML